MKGGESSAATPSPGAVNGPDQSARPPRLSEDLQRIVTALGERQVTLREVIAIMEGRVYTLLLVLLSLPFCTPIPLPGLSTPFGFVIAVLGLRLTFGQRPWLPERLLARPVPSGFFPAMLRMARRMVRMIESVARPRLSYLIENGAMRVACGLTIVICGVLLLLPLPIPFTNLLPALTVILMAAALTERDGVLLLAGFVVFGICLAFFGALYFGGAAAVNWLRELLGGAGDFERDA